MVIAYWLLVVCLGVSFWCCAAGWITQAVNYPLFDKVAPRDFDAYHRAYGRGIVFVVIAPTLLTVLTSLTLIFVRPTSIPLRMALLNAAFGLTALGLTLGVQLPRHRRLQRDGKSDVVIESLIANNIFRALAFTGQAIVTLEMVELAFSALMKFL